MESGFTVWLDQSSDFAFDVRFDACPGIVMDEPSPLGNSKGPNASRLLAAAVANCLSASLLFSLKKFKQDVTGMKTTATGTLVRNEKGRLRMGKIDVEIRLGSAYEHLDRCLSQFEDFCVVTASVRAGIPVSVKVIDAQGDILHES